MARARPRPSSPAIARCEKLFCDDWEQAGHGGELTGAVAAGLVKRAQVTELGDVLAGTAPGRAQPDSITLFDSTGLAIRDLAICLAVLGRSAPAVRADKVRL